MPENLPTVVHKRTRQVSLSTLFILIGLTLVIGLIIGTRSDSLFGGIQKSFGINTGSTSDSLKLSETEEVYQILKKNYDGELDKSQLSEGAAKGLTAAAGDKYTVYMTAEEAKEYEMQLSGSLSGIGAEIGIRDSQPTILRVIDGSPAQKSEIQKGDILVAAGDDSLVDATASEAAAKIRGEAGTSVKIALIRDKKPVEVSIVRAQVSDPSVAYRMEGKVGILTIRRFDVDTGEKARQAAEELVSNGAQSIVLDLRDNGGGYLDQAQSVAGIWLKNKLAVSEKKGDVEKERLLTSGEAVLENVKTIVLVNGSSASASEVVAGALKDNKAATLLGEKTFGKGTVQQIFDLSGGRKIKITIAHWFTPNGINIGKTGIEPDKKVELSIKDADAGRDPQLKAALDSL